MAEAAFFGLCRRYGLEPYRYKGQSHATVMVQSSQSFVDDTLWPEYLELQASLHTYFNEAAERIIREEVYKDAGEAKERDGITLEIGRELRNLTTRLGP